jgi:hypothetical protein
MRFLLFPALITISATPLYAQGIVIDIIRAGIGAYPRQRLSR